MSAAPLWSACIKQQSEKTASENSFAVFCIVLLKICQIRGTLLPEDAVLSHFSVHAVAVSFIDGTQQV